MSGDAVRVFEAIHRPALCLPRHRHDTLKLCVALDGTFVEHDGEQLCTVVAHDVLVRPAARAHVNQYGGLGARALFVELPPDHRAARPLMLRRPTTTTTAATRAAAARLVRAFFSRGVDSAAAPRAIDRAGATRAAAQALIEAAVADTERPHPAWLDVVRARLHERPFDRLALDELARLAGVHRVHLSQAFARHFGRTLTAYLRALRIFAATEKLATGASLPSLALECGFADQSHFTHAFVRERQIAPGRYRAVMQAP